MLKPSIASRVRLQQRPDFESPVLYQSWRDLLFLHWVVPANRIQDTLPEGLSVDTCRGDAYVSVVPFKMRNIHSGILPPVPILSHSLELNLRTYVYNDAGIPGVWFYSLDADNPLLVALARWLYALPYYKASISYEKFENERYLFTSSRRKSGESGGTRLEFEAGATLPPPSSDSLEFFLLERYFFFGYNSIKERFTHGRIHHRPYPIKEVNLQDCSLGVLGENNFGLNQTPTSAHFSPGVDVEVFGRLRRKTCEAKESEPLDLDRCPETALVGEFPNP